MHDVAEVAAPKGQSVGSSIDELYELKQQLKELNSRVDDVKSQIAALEVVVIGQLDQQELDQGRGRRAKVSITETVVPNVVDWEEYQRYILENGALHLLERRAASAAWRELHESGETVPGTEPFKKRGLSVRKA